jgi:aminomethyltransferase
LLDSALGFEVEISEVTEEIAALAVQGPTSCALLKAFGLAGVERLKPFELGHFEVPPALGVEVPIMVSRTGFTGDLGYELWMRPGGCGEGLGWADGAGQDAAVRPIGSRALNIARIEAGFLLPNVDFVSAEHTLRVSGHRALAARAGAGLAGRLQEGALHGPARAAGGGASRSASLAGGLDIEGNKPAHNALLYTEASGRARSAASLRRPGRPPASAISRSRWWTRRTSRPARAVGRDLLEPRTRVGAAHGARAGSWSGPFFTPERRRATPPADY